MAEPSESAQRSQTVDFDLGMRPLTPIQQKGFQTRFQRHRSSGGRFRGDRRASASRSVSPAATPILRMSRTPAPGVQYVAAGMGFDVPGRLLPQNLRRILHAATGFSSFGNQAPQLSSLPVACLISIGRRRDLRPQGLQPRSALLQRRSVKKAALSFLAIPTHGWAAALIPFPSTRLAWSRTGAADTFVAKAWFLI